MHAWSGDWGVAAQMVAAHADAHGPGAPDVPQPQLTSVFTKVS